MMISTPADRTDRAIPSNRWSNMLTRRCTRLAKVVGKVVQELYGVLKLVIVLATAFVIVPFGR